MAEATEGQADELARAGRDDNPSIRDTKLCTCTAVRSVMLQHILCIYSPSQLPSPSRMNPGISTWSPQSMWGAPADPLKTAAVVANGPRSDLRFWR